jgi:glutamine---fructose-6-phosphate transaminase (isomerizing)
MSFEGAHGAADGIESGVANGELTRAAMTSQPEWLRSVPSDRRFPDAKLLFTGCGTSFHAAQTGGDAVQALELVLRPRREADVLVCVSHEGETALTLEAAQAWPGEAWLITGKAESSLAAACNEVVVCTPAIEESWCHTASYTAAVSAIASLNGEDTAWLSGAVDETLAAPPLPVSDHGRWLVAGAARDWPTAQEAVLKLREGAYVAAEAHETEQLLHGYLAAVDESVRAFVLEGEGRGAERARQAVAALEAIGAQVTLVPTRHPVVDIVQFQRLTVDLAEHRGVDPDRIRRDDERWAAAAAAAKTSLD